MTRSAIPGLIVAALLAGVSLAGCKDTRTAEQRQADYEHAEAARARSAATQAYFRDLEVAKVCGADLNATQFFVYRGSINDRLWISYYYNATEPQHFQPVAPGIRLSEVC